MLIPKQPTPDMCAGGGGSAALPIMGGLAVVGLVAFLALR
jgi:MYXO-CTERM domain-containing protein